MIRDYFIKQGNEKQIQQEYFILKQLNQVEMQAGNQTARLFPMVYEYEVQHGIGILKMEKIDGVTLNQIGTMPKSQWILWMKEVAKGLMILHMLRPPIIWCDCKPDNLLVDKEGRIHLIDFDCAFLLKKVPPRASYGTLKYSAPEQREGGVLDERTDIYGFGATFLHMPIKWNWFSIHKILQKCVAKKKEERFQTAGELLYALKKL